MNNISFALHAGCLKQFVCVTSSLFQTLTSVMEAKRDDSQATTKKREDKLKNKLVDAGASFTSSYDII